MYLRILPNFSMGFKKNEAFSELCKECVNMAIQVCWLTMTKWVVTGERKHLANTSSCEKAPPQIPNWLDSRYRTMLASHSSHAGLWLFCNTPICLQICPGTKGNIEPKILKHEDETSRNWSELFRAVKASRDLDLDPKNNCKKIMSWSGRNEACMGFLSMAWMCVASGWASQWMGSPPWHRLQFLFIHLSLPLTAWTITNPKAGPPLVCL